MWSLEPSNSSAGRFAARVLVWASLLIALNVSAKDGPQQLFKSPDGRFVAVVSASGPQSRESRVQLRTAGGSEIRAHDFSSSDGQHGYQVDGARWTPNSQYFVFRMRSSGGHSPIYPPIVLWSRKADRFYYLVDFTGDQMFSVTAPDRVTLSKFPGMQPVTVSLDSVKKRELGKLK